MANNRLYIYCPMHKEGVMLGKHYGGPYNLNDNGVMRFRDFLVEHAFCTNIYLCEENGMIFVFGTPGP